MKTQHYRPNITNGQVSARRTRPVTVAARPPRRHTNSSASPPSAARGKEPAGGQRGSRILSVMLVIGLLLAGGFLLGIHSQISALRINQAEEALKTELDRAANQQKVLDLQQRQAMNLTESERAGREAGLAPLNLDRRTQYRVIPASFTRPVAAVSEVDEEHGAVVKASPRLKAPEAKKGRAGELKATKAMAPTGKPALKLAAKLTAKPASKLVAAKPLKAAAAASSKPAGKALAKPATKLKVAQVSAPKITRAGHAR